MSVKDNDGKNALKSEEDLARGTGRVSIIVASTSISWPNAGPHGHKILELEQNRLENFKSYKRSDCAEEP